MTELTEKQKQFLEDLVDFINKKSPKDLFFSTCKLLLCSYPSSSSNTFIVL